MFACRVLVGEHTQGNPSLHRPPPKDAVDMSLYDSCVDDVCNPSIFVIFKKLQVYPEYLVQYEEESGTVDVSDASLPSRPRTKSLSSSSSSVLSFPRQPTIVTSPARRRGDSMEQRPRSNLTRASRGFGSLNSLNNLSQINASPAFSVPRPQPRMTLYHSPARLRPFITNPPRQRFMQPMTRSTSISALNQQWMF